MTAKQKRTLILLYIRQISAGLLIYQPIFFIFLKSRGISASQFSLLLIAYNIGTLGLVVPAGRFADKIGKKWALFAANIIYTIGTLLIATGDSMPVFVVAEVLYSLAIALDMSTHSAFLFEFLRSQGKENEYYRYDALGMFMALVIGAMGTLWGGYLAENSLDLPIYITAICTAVGIPCAFFLEEPVFPVQKEKASATKVSKSPVMDVARTIIETPGLRWAIGLTVIWFWSRQFINLYLPGPYFNFLHYEPKNFGMLAATLTLSAGFIAFFSRKLIQKPDLRLIATVGLLLIPTGFFIMGMIPSRLGLIGFFAFSIPIGLCTAVTNTLLNRQFTDHAHRTTFLSMVDFCVRLTASCLTYWLGLTIADPARGITIALVNAALVTIVIAVFLLPGIFKYAKASST